MSVSNGPHAGQAQPWALAPLIAIPQWIIVTLEPQPNGRTEKRPRHFITGEVCNAHDPLNWTTYDAATQLAAARGQGWTVGFVITAADPYFCLDIDHALQSTGWSPLAQTLWAALPGCMAEVSVSGAGLHLWGRYPNPPEHAKKRVDLGIELYSTERFIAIGTGQVGEIAPVCDALPAFIAEWFPPRETAPGNSPGDGPRADWRGPTDDADLLRRALGSKSAGSAFGGKASFADLWDRNVTVLAQCYRGDNADGVDWSSVDAALAQHLAFWTGCDHDRIQALMRRSALVRDKWEREDYLPRTIAQACSQQREVLRALVRESPLTALAVPSQPQPQASRVEVLAGFQRWAVTSEKVKDMEDTRLIWRNALAGSHLTVWAAPANAGKTSVALLAAAELSQAGHDVLFFQEDAGAGDLPGLHEHAEANGYRLLNSTLAGVSTDDQVAHLRALASAGADLQGIVMIFDTLKKYLDLMQKAGARDFFKLLRALTQRGATILLLGHTNKHLGADGKRVFEGVGDVRNDVDELAYLESTERNPLGIVTITLKQDKTRSKVTDLSFELDTHTRSVRVLPSVVDVHSQISAARQRERDQPVIDEIVQILKDGPKLSTALRNEAAHRAGVGEKAAGKVINTYDGTIWRTERHRHRDNARSISLIR